MYLTFIAGMILSTLRADHHLWLLILTAVIMTANPVDGTVTRPVVDDPQYFCANATDLPIFTWGDQDTGGPGVQLYNLDPIAHYNVSAVPSAPNLMGTFYFLYESNRDDVPYKYVLIPPSTSVFISVCPTFQGRIVRGSYPLNLDGRAHNLGTWVELNWHRDTGRAWGDVSLLQGNDGPAVVQSMDGLGKGRGFTMDLVVNAPQGSLAAKETGSWCLARIIGDGGNQLARDWQMQFLLPTEVYLVEGVDPVIDSLNGRFQVTFYSGII